MSSLSQISKRQSRRKQRSKATKKKGLAWKIILIAACCFVVLCVLGILGAKWYLQQYLRGEDFRKLASQKTSELTGSKSFLSPIKWAGENFSIDSVAAEKGTHFEKAEISGLEAQIDSSAIWDRKWRILKPRAQRFFLSIDLTKEMKALENSPQEAVPEKKKPKGFFERFLPNKAVFDSAKIESLNLELLSKQGLWALKKAAMQITPEGDFAYKLILSDGELSLPVGPFKQALLESFFARYDKEMISIRELQGSIGASGRFGLIGKFDTIENSGSATLTFDKIEAQEIVPESWVQKISGQISTSSDLLFSRKNGTVACSFSGSFSLKDATLKALPALDTLSAFAGTESLRSLNFSIGQARFSRSEEGVFEIEDIVFACEDLLRIEGSLSINPEQNLSGKLWVGIPPGLLSRIPGAEEKVFLPTHNSGRFGLLWAAVIVGGTTQSPTEDLSQRLVQAAGDRIFQIVPETGQKILNYGTSVSQDLLWGSGTKSSFAPLESATLLLQKPVKAAKDLQQSMPALPGSETLIPAQKTAEKIFDSATDSARSLLHLSSDPKPEEKPEKKPINGAKKETN